MAHAHSQKASSPAASFALTLPPISIVIPAYNEARWLPETLTAILDSRFPCQVVVVDDGSTDDTWEAIQPFRERIHMLRHPQNRGKGAALATGIRAASGDIVVFCDAHLSGLRAHHLLALVLPLVESDARAVLGLDVPIGISPALLRPLPLFMLTGQRAYFRQDLLPLLKEMEDLGYGVETFLFRRFPREKTALVLLPGLVHRSKRETTTPWQAVMGYLQEAREIAETLARTDARLTRLKAWTPDWEAMFSRSFLRNDVYLPDPFRSLRAWTRKRPSITWEALRTRRPFRAKRNPDS